MATAIADVNKLDGFPPSWLEQQAGVVASPESQAFRAVRQGWHLLRAAGRLGHSHRRRWTRYRPAGCGRQAAGSGQAAAGGEVGVAAPLEHKHTHRDPGEWAHFWSQFQYRWVCDNDAMDDI